MNQTWDLSVLYKDFDDPAYAADMAALDAEEMGGCHCGGCEGHHHG